MKITSRLLMGVAILCLLTLFLFPMWQITLVAPQYPDGISMNIWINKITGQELGTLQNINILNHYVGMQYIEPDSIPELTYFPYIIIAMCLLGVGAIAWNKPQGYLIWTIIFVVLCGLGLYDFYLWEYDYGHNLNSNAPIKIEGQAYQPPLIGEKYLLNFLAKSYPHISGVLAVMAIPLGFFAFWKARSPKS